MNLDSNMKLCAICGQGVIRRNIHPLVCPKCTPIITPNEDDYERKLSEDDLWQIVLEGLREFWLLSNDERLKLIFSDKYLDISRNALANGILLRVKQNN